MQLDLTQVIIAAIVATPSIIAAIGAFRASKKIDATTTKLDQKINVAAASLDSAIAENTKVTEHVAKTTVAAAAAASEAKKEAAGVAAAVAKEAKSTKDVIVEIAEKVNGHMDARIVAERQKGFAEGVEHAVQFEIRISNLEKVVNGQGNDIKSQGNDIREILSILKKNSDWGV